MLQTTQTRRFFIFMTALLLLGAGAYAGLARSANSRSSEAQSAAPYDPLTEEELRETNSVVRQAELKPEVNSAEAPTREEVLLVQRLDTGKVTKGKNAGPRQSETFIYNYDSDTLRRVMVDLSTNRIEAVEEMQNVQLPLTASEIERALDLVRTDPVIGQTIREQYKNATGTDLSGLEQLQHKVFIFQADTLPNQVNEASQLCGLQRCAQVLLFTEEKMAFEITPIVNLSQEKIIQLMWVEE